MRSAKQLLPCKKSPPAWYKAFLAMLPGIECHAQRAFCHLATEARAEAVQQVVCGGCAAFARLVALNELALACPTALARCGVAQTRDGCQVGGRLKTRTVSSPQCQCETGITAVHLDRFDGAAEAWRDVPREDRPRWPVKVAMIDPMLVLNGGAHD